MSKEQGEWDERELGKPTDVTADDMIRAMVGQLWENDNDEGELSCTLEGADGNISTIVFGITIKSIDGAEVE